MSDDGDYHIHIVVMEQIGSALPAPEPLLALPGPLEFLFHAALIQHLPAYLHIVGAFADVKVIIEAGGIICISL